MTEQVTFPKRMSKEEINNLPLRGFEGEIHLVTTVQGATKAINELAQHSVLGFDTETRPSFKKGEWYPISLLQLSTKNDAYLFRLNLFDMTQEIIDLFCDPKIIKAGVAIGDDLKELKKIVAFEDQGFVELAELAKKKGIQTLGLRSLAAIFMNVKISKAAKLTNWEHKVLTPAQKLYAATDAWVGRELYQHLSE